MTVDAQLNGESLERLRDILLESLDRQGLDELCQEVLRQRLSAVTDSGAGNDVARQLLTRAQREGVLVKLVRRAAWRQPQYSQLDAFLQEFWPPPVPRGLLVMLEKLLSGIAWETLEKAHAPMAGFLRTWTEADLVAERRLTLIEALADQNRGIHDYPLLEFVLRVISLEGDSRVRELKGWTGKAAAALKVPTEVLEDITRRVNAERPLTPLYLLIKIDRVEEEATESCELVAWLTGHGGEDCVKVFGGDGTRYPREQVNEQVEAILRKVESRWSDRLLAAGDQLTIEFFLPRALLCEPFDCAQVSFDGPKPIWLGTRYTVAVRPSERLANEPTSRGAINHKQKWKEFQARRAGSNATLWITQAEAARSNAVSLALSRPCPFSLGLTLPAEPFQLGAPDIIMDCIIKPGIPIALWPRPSQCEGNPETEMRPLLEQVSKLVHKVADFRSKAFEKHPELHLGGYLIVLWDDPERIPEELRRD